MGRAPGSRRLTPQELEAQLQIADLPPVDGSRVRIEFSELTSPIWTENKAQLIARYLRYFCYITHHGTYIDGFAGPQRRDREEMWAAKQVLETEPWRLRNFFLCELNAKSLAALHRLVDGRRPRTKKDPQCRISILSGDFNKSVDAVLASGVVTEKEATFCLLDQRTFECQWSTVKKLADHKKIGTKIELFYFLPAHWLYRALASVKDRSVIHRWWGRDDYEQLRQMRDNDRASEVCERFRSELGYRHAYAWPIHTRKDGGRVKYHMVHATDHDAAPKLMQRAYRSAVHSQEPWEQSDWIAELDTLGTNPR